MSELRPDQRIAFVCPIGGCIIDGLDASQTKDAPAPVGWEPPGLDIVQTAASYAIAQNMQANEALILAHVQSSHTVGQIMLVLGRARVALQEIAPLADVMRQYETAAANAIDDAVSRGLGEQ